LCPFFTVGHNNQLLFVLTQNNSGTTLLDTDMAPVGSIQPTVSIPGDTGEKEELAAPDMPVSSAESRSTILKCPLQVD
jgi:hypothetical protein